MTLGVSTAFWISYVLLWCLVVVLVLLIVLLYRQFGLTFMRSVDRVMMQGLSVGGRAPDFAIADRNGNEQSIAFGADRDGGRATAVLFAMPGCTVCATLAKTLVTLPAQRSDVRFVWVDGSSPSPPERAIEAVPGWIAGSVAGDTVHRLWEVSAVPFGFVIAPNGRIADKRLMNRREDLDTALKTVAESAAGAHSRKELIS